MSQLIWRTKISYVERNKVVVRGYRLDELIGRVSYGEMLYLMFNGELPPKEWKRALDALLVAGCDHSVFCPSVSAARLVASGGVGLQNAIASGINAMGRYHGGAIEDAMKLFYDVKARGDEVGLEKAAEEAVGKLLAEGKRVPGFGHKIHTDDPRVKKLLEIARECGLDRGYIRAALEVGRALEKAGRRLPMNIDGAMAAVACELGFDWRAGRAIFALSRALGVAAHAYEEMVEGEPFKEIPLEEIVYEGPGERRL